MPTTKPVPVEFLAAFPDLETRAAVRLHPRSGHAAPGASAVGGSPVWPAHEPWPSCTDHGDPLVAVLQLRSDDVPELEGPRGWRLFQLLWCPKAHDRAAYGPKIETFWRLRDVTSQPAPPTAAPDADESFIPRPCRIWPERVVELPHPSELGSSTVRRLEQWIEDHLPSLLDAGQVWPFTEGVDRRSVLSYQSSFSSAPGTKVAGFPHWIQEAEYPACREGHRMAHLLTISGDEFDGGTWWRWVTSEERGVWNGPTDVRLAVQGGAFSFPQDGSVFVFVCRRCDEFPAVGVFQCS